MKIFDCSNSIARPAHRNGGGPKQNDIMRYLQENAHQYDCSFVDSAGAADIIITNDVYPEEVIKLDRPKVKRMCSPFWRSSLQYRNISLNRAAEQSNKVLFISDYSRDSYKEIFGINFAHTVVKHWVDTNVFYPRRSSGSCDGSVISSATDWNREEKRIGEVIKLAESCPDIQFKLIGKCEIALPANVKSLGYISSPDAMAEELSKSRLFINLTYRDAATKTVPQALSCGVPVFYSSSGGVGEFVSDGVKVIEIELLGIEDNVPGIGRDISGEFRKVYNNPPKVRCLKHKFKEMLNNYFFEIKKF
jgi:glycosyltransferase involved in cell wall biosynthesis